MYSTIANNSFSYLLTLDEIRKDLPDETRPSWIKITTITMVSSFMQQIDIKRLRGLFEEIGSYKMRRVVPKQMVLSGNWNRRLSTTKWLWLITTVTAQSLSRYSPTVRSKWRVVVISSIANASSPNLFIFSKPFWVWKLKYRWIHSVLLWLTPTSVSTTISTSWRLPTGLRSMMTFLRFLLNQIGIPQ